MQSPVDETATALSMAVAGYFFFLYVVVHYAGVFLGVWQ